MATRIERFDTWLTDYFQHFSQPLPGMLVLVGKACTGKSTMLKQWLISHQGNRAVQPALQRYVSQDDERSAPLFRAHLFTAITRETPTQCSRRLIEELGAHSDARSANALWLDAAQDLHNFGIDLLILDQAERLSLLLWESPTRLPLRPAHLLSASRWNSGIDHNIAPRSCTDQPCFRPTHYRSV